MNTTEVKTESQTNCLLDNDKLLDCQSEICFHAENESSKSTDESELLRNLRDTSLSVRDAAIKTLLSLATSSISEMEIIEEKIVMPLILLLHSDALDLEGKRYYTKAIAVLATDVEYERLFSKTEVMELFMLLLKGTDDVTVKKNVVDILINMVTVNARNQHLIATTGAIELLVELVQHTDTELCCLAINALVVMVKGNDKNQKLMIQAGCVKSLVCLLTIVDKEIKATVRATVADALVDFTGMSEMMKKSAAREGAIESLIGLFQETNAKLRGRAVEAVCSIADSKETQVHAARAGAIQPLISLLQDTDDDVRAKAAAALRIIAHNNNRNKSLITNAGAIQPLIKLLYDSATYVRWHAARSIGSITSTLAAIKVRAVKEGVLTPLITLLKDAEVKIRHAACKALWRLAVDVPAFQVAIVEAGAMAPLLSLVQDEEEEKNGKRFAVETLILFSMHQQLKERMMTEVAQQAISSVVALLRDKDLETRHSAARLLIQLASGNTINQVLVTQSGAMDALVSLFHDADADMRCDAVGLLTTLLADNAMNQLLFAKTVGAEQGLWALLEDNDEDVRSNVDAALSYIIPDYHSSSSNSSEEVLGGARAGVIAPLT